MACLVYRHLVLDPRRTVASWLERGALDGRCSRALAALHARVAARALVRPLSVPSGMAVVTVGGATLGGSGKTRVALAVTRELARRGANVVLIGHAYRARPSRARVVAVDDPLEEVGDEALACVRVLDGQARVVVAPARQAAVDFIASARTRPDVLVFDGPLQLSPVPAALALLAVDADAPWGAGALPPAGDLRAPPAALLAHADLVVPVDASPSAVILDGARVSLSILAARGVRLGLFTALARPARLERALARLGVPLAHVLEVADHGADPSSLARRLASVEVDHWLATPKCVLHLPSKERGVAAVLVDDLDLPVSILDALGRLSPSISPTAIPRDLRQDPARSSDDVGSFPTCVA